MKYTQVPADAFQHLQMNAGILVDAFNPATGVIGNILGASSGGISFNANTTFVDRGSDIDNCPKNTKELKDIEDIEVTLGGTFVTITAATAKQIAAAADVDSLNANHIVPRRNILQSDFNDLWWIGDYSNNNGSENGGYCAIHVMNGLSTGGFNIQSRDREKGTFGFTFMGHFSLENQDVVPYEVFVKEGTPEDVDGYMDVLSEPSEDTEGNTIITTSVTAGSGEGYVYQTGARLLPPAKGSILKGSAWTSWNGTSEIASESGLQIAVAIIDTTTKACKKSGVTIVTVLED